jgi:hypothetical protein
MQTWRKEWRTPAWTHDRVSLVPAALVTPRARHYAIPPHRASALVESWFGSFDDRSSETLADIAASIDNCMFDGHRLPRRELLARVRRAIESGALVAIRRPPRHDAAPPIPERKPKVHKKDEADDVISIAIEVVDDLDASPLPDVAVELELPDGSRTRRSTDRAGHLAVRCRKGQGVVVKAVPATQKSIQQIELR